MHHIQAVYEHRWAVPIALAVGVVVIAIGIAIRGSAGTNVVTAGAILCIAAHAEARIRRAVLNGHAEAHRAGYRLGMRVRRAQLTAVSYPQHDELVASK